ncbi:PEBP-like protein, partial [Zopfia rhizophila CBS 207.26]
LRMHYPASTITSPGSTLSREASKPPPTLSISFTVVKSKTATYIALCLDLDAPFPSVAILSPILHGIQADLTPQGEPDAEDWIKLTPGAKPTASYLPPNPPKFSGAHRYVFLIWEQPEGLTKDKIKSDLGLPDEVGLGARIRWDEDSCEKKLGLGD